MSTSLTTPLDGALLSPDNITLGGQNNARGFVGLLTGDLGAYTMLQDKCQRLEYNLMKEKEDHKTLKFISSPSHANIICS
jgi:hypothetical protein